MEQESRVWVGCLACYNAGRLRGEWVDAEEASDLVPCRLPGHEEWWCFDLEGPVAALVGGECSPVEAQRWANLAHDVEESTGAPAAAFAAWVDYQGKHYVADLDDREIVDDFTEAWAGKWDSVEDWAWEWLEDTGTLMRIPVDLRGYFNVKAWARDAELGGDVYTIDAPGGGVFVFWSSR